MYNYVHLAIFERRGPLDLGFRGELKYENMNKWSMRFESGWLSEI